MKEILLAITLMLPLMAEGAAMKTTKKATFAGGCFWCLQPPFDSTKGVLSTTVGYTGGKKIAPDYEEVSTGSTGHAEAIEVIYDPAQTTYAELLDVFWMSIDPTQANGQFADHGSQYRTAIFVHDEEQRRQAEASKAKLAASGRFDRPIVTEITNASAFYPAEDYHQKYYLKNQKRYERYHQASGREAFIERVWGAGKAGLQPFNQISFERDQATGKTIVLDFHADWCPTCGKQKASLEKVLEQGASKHVVAYQVDYDHADDLKSELKVRSQSTLIVFKGTQEVGRATGITDVAAISRLLQKAL